ncbi:MAG: S8 family peptidase [Segetibacter sp.]
MKKNYVLLGILSFAIFTSCRKDINSNGQVQEITAAQQAGDDGQKLKGEKFEPNELLVKFKKGTSETDKAKALAKMSGKMKEHILTKAMEQLGDEEGVYLIQTSLDALEAISKAKGVEFEFAEPNYIYTYDAISTDPYYTNGSLWGMHGDATSPANQFGSQAGEAWAAGHTGSKSVYVGIIDEGIQFTHPDLNSQVWTNPYDPANGIDDDLNGLVDDIHGWDFAGNDNSIYDGGKRGTADDHGTHVSGTIGAKNDGSGVVGMNWNITLISGKFLGTNGGTTANAIKAVDYFTDLKNKRGLNIVATNNSWGGGGYSQALYDAISRANNAGILFIAAAGNSGVNNDATASYPSNYDLPNVIAVAAIDKLGALASFSNYGATQVDLGAPGVAVWSTTAFNTYSSYNGTSMATPHVTGAAALYAASNPGATAVTIKAAILDAAKATPTASLAGKCVTGGRLNVSGF